MAVCSKSTKPRSPFVSVNSSLPALPVTLAAPISTIVRPVVVSTWRANPKLPDTLMKPAMVNETEPPTARCGSALPPLPTWMGTLRDPAVSV